MNGIPQRRVIRRMRAAESRTIFLFSTTHGPAISTNGAPSPILISPTVTLKGSPVPLSVSSRDKGEVNLQKKGTTIKTTLRRPPCFCSLNHVFLTQTEA